MDFIPYVRRSRSDEDVVSIADQKTAIERWAERSEVSLLPWVVEPLGTSGAKSWRERQVGDIVRRLEDGEADGIAVAYFSRLSRELHSQTFELLEALQPFRRADARSGRVTEPGEELGWVDVIEAHQARQERQTLRKHLSSGKHSCWERGAVVSGRMCPISHAFEREPFQNRMRPGPLRKSRHADAISDAIRARGLGASWSEVARMLEAASIPNSIGDGRWRTQSVSALFRSPILKGVLRCTCGCGAEKFVEELAIVTPSEWAAAQPETGAHGRGRAPNTGRALLAGIARCGSCGRALVRSNNGQGLVTYRCQNNVCDARVTAMLAELDELVLDATLEHWLEANPMVGAPASTQELAAIEHRVERARAELAEVESERDELSPLEYARGTAEAERRILEAEQELADARAQGQTPVNIDLERATLTGLRALAAGPNVGTAQEAVEDMRRALRRELEQVVVHRAARGTPLRERTHIVFSSG